MRFKKTATACIGAALLATSVAATTFTLPNLAIEPSSIGDIGGNVNVADLSVNEGNGVVAINVNIQYLKDVATPGTPVLGDGAPGFIIESNILNLDATTDELRVVVYANPTASFAAGNNPIVRIPWNAVGSTGESTPLSFSGSEGASDSNGNSIIVNWVGGKISILNTLTAGAETPAPDDLSAWVGFFSLTNPLSVLPDANNTPNILGQGSSNIGFSTTNDGARDGVAAFSSPVDTWTWAADSLYRVDWTATGTTDGGATLLPKVRFKAYDNASNTFTELEVSGSTGGNIFNADGSPQVFPMYFEPSDLTDNVGATGQVGIIQGPLDNMRLEFDIVDLVDNVMAGEIRVSNVSVYRFSRSGVDALFASEYAVTDFSDDSQWTQIVFPDLDSDGENEIPLPEGTWLPGTVGAVEIQELTTYTEEVTGVTLGTSLNSNSAGPQTDTVSVGEFGEATINAERVTLAADTIYRFGVNLTRLNNQGDPDPVNDSAAQIKLRAADATQTMSSSVFVEPVGSRPVNNPNNAAAGNNRPPAGSTAAYRTYLAYPSHFDFQALADAGANKLGAVFSLIDLDNNNFEGNLRITSAVVESLPANALELP